MKITGQFGSPGFLALIAIMGLPVMANSSQDSVEVFVKLNHIHGVPYGLAHDFGPAALPTLERLLEQEDLKPFWPNILTTIGFIGDSRGQEIIHRFVWDRFTNEVDLSTFQALIAAQGILGHIAAYGGPELLAELERGVNPENWKGLPWFFENYRGDRLALLWSKLTINALAYTGKPSAGEILARLRERPYSPSQISNIEEGLQRHQEIVQLGLDTYERRRDQQREGQ